MTMQRWTPFADFGRAFGPFGRPIAFSRPIVADASRWRIPTDVAVEEENLVVRASLPGVEPEKIEVTLEDGILTIAGETSAESQEQKGDFLLRERRWGKFHRALKLPGYVDADRAEPKYANGVLTITLPKREASKARRLEVSAD